MATIKVTEWDGVDKSVVELQKLEEKAAKAQEAFEKEEKLRKELEVLNAKLLEEKTALLSNLEGGGRELQDTQERAAKLQAQKNDLESQLRVSRQCFINLFHPGIVEVLRKFLILFLKVDLRLECNK